MPGIEVLCKRTGLKSKDIKALFAAIVDTLANEPETTVVIQNFGTFRLYIQPGRTVQSPVINGGEPVEVKDQKIIKFHSAPGAKARIVNMERARKRATTHSAKVLADPPKRAMKPKPGRGSTVAAKPAKR